MMKTLILGLGNPILRDDSVGLRVVRKLGERMAKEDEELWQKFVQKREPRVVDPRL